MECRQDFISIGIISASLLGWGAVAHASGFTRPACGLGWNPRGQQVTFGGESQEEEEREERQEQFFHRNSAFPGTFFYRAPLYAPVYTSPAYVAPPPAQQPFASDQPRPLSTFNAQLQNQRQRLQDLLRRGQITLEQYNAAADYLTQVDKDANAQASMNGGQLTPSEERALIARLQQVNTLLGTGFASTPGAGY